MEITDTDNMNEVDMASECGEIRKQQTQKPYQDEGSTCIKSWIMEGYRTCKS